MPHPKAPTLSSDIRPGLPGRPFIPQFAPKSVNARNLEGLPPGASGGSLFYGSAWAWAWLEGCGELAALGVETKNGLTTVVATLDKAGMCILLIFAGHDAPSASEFPVAGAVSLSKSTVHRYTTRLEGGDYRVYAASGEELYLDGPEPLPFFVCGVEVSDISHLIAEPGRLRFEVALSSPARIAAAVIPQVTGGLYEIRQGWLSPDIRLVHQVDMPAPQWGRHRVIVFGLGEPQEA